MVWVVLAAFALILCIGIFCGAYSSRISEEKFRELMLHGNDMASDVGTVVYGEEAVQLGLIDRVGQLKDAYEALYAML